MTKLSTHYRVATLLHSQKSVIFLRRMRLLGKQLFHQPRFPTVLYLLCCGLTLIIILVVGLIKHPTVVAAQTPTPDVVDETSDTRIRCQYNAYVMRLNDFNVAEGTFFIDVWLSANYNNPDAPGVSKLDFPTAKDYKFLNTNTVKTGKNFYFNSNLEGKFTHDWNLENYPFDRHRLELFLRLVETKTYPNLCLNPI